MCRKEKFSECPGNPRRYFLELIRIFGERINARGPTACPRDRGVPPLGRAPYLVGPLETSRLQLQLYISAFGEKKIGEKISSRFMIRSRCQALKPLGRAELESVRGYGEGNPLPSSSSVGERSNFKKIPTHTQDHGDA